MRAGAMAALGLLAGGCLPIAPDTISNIDADQFNAFLNTIQAQCQPLQVGDLNLSEIPPLMNTDSYAPWLDNTSRLFYGRITPAQYKASFLSYGTDPTTTQSIDCIIAKLPAKRPNAPPPLF
jgi:hypothetical protein